MSRFFTFIIFFCSSLVLSAQENDSSFNAVKGTVVVKNDWRFDDLAAKQAEINKNAQKYTVKRVKGWRIQAANTNNRDEANAVKAELLRRFPEEKTYMLYQAPSFRVRIGNFEEQRDAFQLRKIITALYPGKGIYIVPDVIEVAPPTDDEDVLNK